MTTFTNCGLLFDESHKIIGIDNREDAIKAILNQLASSQDAETYRNYHQMLLSMDDRELLEYLQKDCTIVHCDSQKDVIKALTDLAASNGITRKNSALNAMPLTFQEEKYNNEMLAAISRSHPSDCIELDYKAIDAMTDLWAGSKKDNPGIPSDLFFAHTIPLMDFYLSVSDEDRSFPRYRIMVHPDYAERIETAGEDDFAEVGEIFVRVGDGNIIVPIITIKGVDRLLTGELGYQRIPAKVREAMSKEESFQTAVSLATFILQMWYGIQIALLHPTVRDVFSHPGRYEVKKPGQKHKGKRKTMYVKRHVINADDIQKASRSGGFERNTLVWYVIGHWRTYKNGTKVFIHPYWKGPLREIKQNLDDRERIIYTGGIKNA